MKTLGLWEEETAPGCLLLRAFFDQNQDTTSLLQALSERIPSQILSELQVVSESVLFDAEQWVEAYRASATAVSLADTIYVHPPWQANSSQHRVNIEIEPSHAFGTGTHESTQLCLESLVELAPRSKTMLDVGTGSGILAIAAAKLNPDIRVIAFDIDVWAAAAAHENVLRNNIPQVQIVAGTSRVFAGSFDLVVANLTLQLLLQMSVEMRRLVDRHLLISGFTVDQAARVAEIFQGWLQLESRRERNGWVSLVLLKHQ
jgi:ribosomal protein L11 methyltransferase